jgi:hypothetical protein
LKKNKIIKNLNFDTNTILIYKCIIANIETACSNGKFSFSYYLPNDDSCDNIKIKKMLDDDEFEIVKDKYNDHYITITW